MYRLIWALVLALGLPFGARPANGTDNNRRASIPTKMRLRHAGAHGKEQPKQFLVRKGKDLVLVPEPPRRKSGAKPQEEHVHHIRIKGDEPGTFTTVPYSETRGLMEITPDHVFRHRPAQGRHLVAIETPTGAWRELDVRLTAMVLSDGATDGAQELAHTKIPTHRNPANRNGQPPEADGNQDHGPLQHLGQYTREDGKAVHVLSISAAALVRVAMETAPIVRGADPGGAYLRTMLGLEVGLSHTDNAPTPELLWRFGVQDSP